VIHSIRITDCTMISFFPRRPRFNRTLGRSAKMVYRKRLQDLLVYFIFGLPKFSSLLLRGCAQ
jgi:hypothetical protein